MRDEILKFTDKIEPIIYDCVDSTNAVARSLAADSFPEKTAVIARRQTSGRGRLGRSFFSPEGGIYMSLILRPKIAPEKTLFITVAAACAAALAIERVSGKQTKIKWVNDIYIDGKKVCGILTEGGINPKAATLDYAVLGVGINVTTSQQGFPSLPLADSVFGDTVVSNNVKAQIIAEFANTFFKFYENLEQREFLTIYREKSFLNGKRVTYTAQGVTRCATAVGIDDDARLIVSENGKNVHLSSGEVQIAEWKTDEN